MLAQDKVIDTLVVLIAIFGAVLLVGMLLGVLRRRPSRDNLQTMTAPPQPPPPQPMTHGFPVIIEDPRPVELIGTGRGRYRVCGVVAKTKADVTMHMEADSPANAKVKAELTGVIVTDVSKES